MKIARRPLTDEEERTGQIEWLTDLREKVLSDDPADREDAVRAIDAAIQLTKRFPPAPEKGER